MPDLNKTQTDAEKKSGWDEFKEWLKALARDWFIGGPSRPMNYGGDADAPNRDMERNPDRSSLPMSGPPMAENGMGMQNTTPQQRLLLVLRGMSPSQKQGRG